jgi:NAD(P)-dependent dehydrogenase (short-subunit alcohol dehydrogenase family)
LDTLGYSRDAWPARAKIAISDLDKLTAKAAADKLTAAGHEAFYFAGDMLDRTFPVKLVEAVLTKFGKINCLINNAGQSSSFACLKINPTVRTCY